MDLANATFHLVRLINFDSFVFQYFSYRTFITFNEQI